MAQNDLYNSIKQLNALKAANNQLKQVINGTWQDPTVGYDAGARAVAQDLTDTSANDQEQAFLNQAAYLNKMLNGANTPVDLSTVQGASDINQSYNQYNNRSGLTQVGDTAKTFGQNVVQAAGGLATLGALPFGQAENVGNFVNDLDEAIDASKSDAYQSGNLYKQYRSQVIDDWAKRKYGENPTGIDSLAQVGSALIKHAQNMTGSEVLEDTVGLTGQLLTAGGMGKAASLTGNAVARGIGAGVSKVAPGLASKVGNVANKLSAARTTLAT